MKATILILMAGSGMMLAEDQQGQGPPPRPLSPVMEALDVDKDGALSAEEITNASEILASLDTDDNGRLSEEETAPPKPEGDDKEKEKPRRGGPPPVDPVMASLDQNGDGTLSKREIARATKSLLELDEDESGKLEEEEMKPDEPTGGPGGEEGGPGGGGRPPHPPRGGR
ncbi:hypothetical protein [Roseibacillus persicicus]|uniref:hypothetical protein n=1 Tax=Roseibacillus persicicus TaxID=454148 RepID=UPI00280F18EA|nr:hypothetical protein [Roseibacillus persicicus]MDQ8191978.1 hypothetical protein [Roseibacillus persicicus]